MNESCCGKDGHAWHCPKRDASAVCTNCGKNRGMHATKDDGNIYCKYTTLRIELEGATEDGRSTFKSKKEESVAEIIATTENTEPKLRRFGHLNGIPNVGTVVKVKTVNPGSREFYIQFPAGSAGIDSLSTSFVWNALKIENVPSTGEEFKIVKKDGAHIIVEDVTVKKAIPTKKASVTIPIDKVKKAAQESPEAKKILESLCPEAFVKEDVKPTFPKGETDVVVGPNGVVMLERKYGGNLDGFLWLSDKYDWRIEKDGEGAFVLIPKEK